ncbi:ComF family protein [Intestinibacillus massiliensis]|uniref:ComF family protein n=1 Tax=Intestinibacillus massiliensis TaxID=1871029 RepID=UPI000B350C3C|nr:ComF family protein [Intestinibacillus massiliensis]
MKLIRALFPQRCVLCRCRLAAKGDAVLCPSCAAQVRTEYRTQGQVLVDGTDGAAAALLYRGRVREAMHRYKFSRAKGYARWFAAQLAPVVGVWLDDWRPDCVTYVPVGAARYWGRGYNQSALVARRIAKQFGLPCVPLLRKSAFIGRQSAKNHAQRSKNVQHAFHLRRNAQTAGKRILLVDDVLTTGATLSACAHVLREGGAERVFVVAMTKTPG